MGARNRTPSILEPYLVLPPTLSQTLLTSTISCSATWLAARFVANALKHDEVPTSIVIISWLRDEAFWRSEVKRVANISLDKNGSFLFVDRLTEGLRTPIRSDTDELHDILTKILLVVEQTQKAFIIFDIPELLLSLRPQLQVSQLNSTLLKIRSLSNVHCTLMLCMADMPCLTGEQRTTAELSIASFLIQQAHLSRLILSVRELNTGSARDVSGMLRITNNSEDTTLKELERRYLVQRDGSVKMD